MCDGILDCAGGTDEVDCGFCKTFIAMHLIYVWKNVWSWLSQVEILSCILIALLHFKHCSAELLLLPRVVFICAV